MKRLLRNSVLAFSILGGAISAHAGDYVGIYILSGVYDPAGRGRMIDVTSRLQDLCGSQSASCDVWCAQSSFGGRDPGRHGVCRVMYRCPDGATRAAEAGRDEPILMHCRSEDRDDPRALAPAR